MKEASGDTVFIACNLPGVAQRPFAETFSCRFNDTGRVLAASEVIAGCEGATALVVTATDKLGAEVIAALPDSVRIVATYSVGHEHIDLPAAAARNLVVLHTPDVLSESCADIGMLLMLGAARRALEGLHLVRSGEWTGWQPGQLLGTDIHGKRLGIFGMGRIGRAIAKRARGFDMEVHYHNRRRLDPAEERGAVYHESLEAMLALTDVLCVAAPGGRATRGMINGERLALMPAGAIVTNISRGDIIDDAALVAALRSGQVAAAGLDVFANEPDIHPAYRKLDNVFALPHSGSATSDTRRRMSEFLCAGIREELSGRVASNRLALG